MESKQQSMNLLEKLHMVHRFWRYRLWHESDSIKFLLKQDLFGSTVIDMGANRGIYSYWLSKKVGPHGKVIAFEPQPELEPCLNRLRNSFGLSNLQIENKGLSNQCGEAFLFRISAGAATAALCERMGQEKVRVDITTLDDYLADKENSRISFIKADIEGHELHAFKGAENAIVENRPTILFECHHEHAVEGGVFAFLESLGYSGFFIHQGKKIESSRFDEFPYRRPDESFRNYIFTHDQAITRRTS